MNVYIFSNNPLKDWGEYFLCSPPDNYKNAGYDCNFLSNTSEDTIMMALNLAVNASISLMMWAIVRFMFKTTSSELKQLEKATFSQINSIKTQETKDLKGSPKNNSIIPPVIPIPPVTPIRIIQNCKSKIPDKLKRFAEKIGRAHV